MNTESAKPPVAKLRIGLIAASIWERTNEKGTFHSVTFERRYRTPQASGTRPQASLLALAKIADQAHSEIARLTRKEAAA